MSRWVREYTVSLLAEVSYDVLQKLFSCGLLTGVCGGRDVWPCSRVRRWRCVVVRHRTTHVDTHARSGYDRQIFLVLCKLFEEKRFRRLHDKLMENVLSFFRFGILQHTRYPVTCPTSPKLLALRVRPLMHENARAANGRKILEGEPIPVGLAIHLARDLNNVYKKKNETAMTFHYFFPEFSGSFSLSALFSSTTTVTSSVS